MNVPSIRATNTNFRNSSSKTSTSKPSSTDDENPISRKGEIANLTKATFIGGLAVAGKLLWEIIIDGDFLLEDLADIAGKTVEKNKKDATAGKKVLYKVGAFFALIAAAVSGFALLYTAYKAPNIAYESKVNTFKNKKEMDVYIKSNKAEKEIYTQLAEKAKESDTKDKEKLKEQYVKMTVAKNQLPQLV